MTADYNYFVGILDELDYKGIVILRPVDYDRFYNLLKQYSLNINVGVSIIGSGASTRAVLRRGKYIDKSINYYEIKKEGDYAYESKDYDLFIEKYRQLLIFSKAYIYAKLGLAYAKKFNKCAAKDYLTVATELAKREKSDYELTELIMSLKKMIDSNDKKHIFEMTTENIREAIELILFEEDIDSACAKLCMNEEQKSIVCLLLARDLYALSQEKMGDYYLEKVREAVRETKVKSNKVFYLLKEIETNKLSYSDKFFYYNSVYYNDYEERPKDTNYVKVKYLKSEKFLGTRYTGHTSLWDEIKFK